MPVTTNGFISAEWLFLNGVISDSYNSVISNNYNDEVSHEIIIKISSHRPSPYYSLTDSCCGSASTLAFNRSSRQLRLIRIA
jgi:hypothetical protein